MATPYTTQPFAEGKKISCQVQPLAHTGLKRIPYQTYLGKILYSIEPAKSSQAYVFATPHGLILQAAESEFHELTADQYHQLEELEQDAITAKKEFYGGEVGLREFLLQQNKGKRKTK